MTRHEFLVDRQRGMGGTNMAMLLGLYPKKDALDLYYEKTRPLDEGLEEQPTIHQLRGRVTEPLAADLYWGFTGRQGRKAPEVVTHPQYPAFRCHLDYTVFSTEERPTGVLDIKCPMTAVFGRVAEHGARQSEIVQMQTYLAVSRRSWGSLGYCNLEHSAGPILSVDLDYDAQLGFFLLEAGQRFWDEHVLKGVPPDPEEWKLLAREDAPPVLELSGDVEIMEDDITRKLATEVLDAAILRKKAGEVYDAAMAKVKELMVAGKHGKIEVPAVGKLTLIQAQGRKFVREDTLRAAKPIDRDKLLSWMSENGFIDPTGGVFTLEDLTAMELDFDLFMGRGDPYSFVRATDRRPEGD